LIAGRLITVAAGAAGGRSPPAVEEKVQMIGAHVTPGFGVAMSPVEILALATRSAKS
jgi:hypothetical protein